MTEEQEKKLDDIRTEADSNETLGRVDSTSLIEMRRRHLTVQWKKAQEIQRSKWGPNGPNATLNGESGQTRATRGDEGKETGRPPDHPAKQADTDDRFRAKAPKLTRPTLHDLAKEVRRNKGQAIQGDYRALNKRYPKLRQRKLRIGSLNS